MKLVPHDDPILTTPCLEFNFADPPFDPIEFAKEIVAFMYERNGLGLSSNQIGVPYRLFAMRGSPQNFVCINPRLIHTSTERVLLDEGCLSFPGMIVKIKRPSEIRVRFQLPNGDTQTHKFTGITARVVQHEIDHLDGILYFNRASRYHREQALRRWRNIS